MSTTTPAPTARAPPPNPSNPSDSNPPSSLSPLESTLLNEYHLLNTNLQTLSTTLNHLAEHPTAEILDGLRLLERKTSLVCTLLKASVYSIVLQQEVMDGGGGGEGG
ncbi:DASH complex subunit dad3 [Bachmanniomyces sp. S44760]|nr:DASH complex subunit dad3 [Bachmanniomyces sp. S44760]